MQKTTRPALTSIQKRFFEALDTIIAAEKSDLKSFCDKYGLNRVRYSSIRSEIRNPETEKRYKTIDIDALFYLCSDYGIFAKWILTGKGKMTCKR